MGLAQQPNSPPSSSTLLQHGYSAPHHYSKRSFVCRRLPAARNPGFVDKTHKLYKAMGATYVGLPLWREDTIGIHFDRQRYLGIFGPALCTTFIPWPKITADVLVP